MTLGEALKAGATHTVGRPGSLLVAAGAIAEAVAGVALPLALLAAAEHGPRVWAVGAAGVLLAGLLARLLQLAALAGSLRAAWRWLSGRPEEGPFEAIARAAPRALAFFAFSLPIDAALFLWKWLGLAAVGAGYAHALATGRGGLLASAGLAFFLALTGLLLTLDALWRRAALVRAVVHDRGVARSLLEALTLVGERPFSRAAAVVVPLAAGLAAALVVSVAAGLLGGVGGEAIPRLEVQLLSQLTTVIPTAFVLAYAELVAVQALAGLDLPGAAA